MSVGEAKSLLIESDIYLSLGLTNFCSEEVYVYQIIQNSLRSRIQNITFCAIELLHCKKGNVSLTRFFSISSLIDVLLAGPAG